MNHFISDNKKMFDLGTSDICSDLRTIMGIEEKFPQKPRKAAEKNWLEVYTPRKKQRKRKSKDKMQERERDRERETEREPDERVYKPQKRLKK